MAYWLVKSEPSAWSWDQQVAKGPRAKPGPECATSQRGRTCAMKKGDLAFFYHSKEGKEIVGIAEIISRGLSRSH